MLSKFNICMLLLFLFLTACGKPEPELTSTSTYFAKAPREAKNTVLTDEWGHPINNLSSSSTQKASTQTIVLNTTPVTISNITYNQDWLVSRIKNNIYLISFPIASQGITSNRGIHYLMIQKDTTQDTLSVSIVGGKILNTFYPVIIKMPHKRYNLYIYDNRAWLINKTDINSFLANLQKNSTFKVINTFQDKTYAIDTYSTKGFLKAYLALKAI